MKCEQCGNYQDSGKFCGKCGGAMVEAPAGEQIIEVQEEVAATNEVPSQAEPVQSATNEVPNEHIEQVKETTKAYWGYYLRFIKKPSEAFRETNQFINGLISLILVSVIIAIIGTIVVPGEVLYFMDISKVTIFFNMFLVVAVPMALVILSVFLIIKFVGKALSFKEVVSLYGTQSLLGLTLTVVSLLLMIISAYAFSSFLLFIALMLMFAVVPSYLIISLLREESKGVDPFYGYLFYLILSSILIFVASSILLDSVIGSTMEIFEDLLKIGF